MNKFVRAGFLLVMLLFAFESASFADASRNRIINASRPGMTIAIQKHLVPGKTNLVCFFSRYCGACRAVLPDLDKLVEKNPDLVLDKVDINRPGVKGIDWKSPVARQYKVEYTPFFKIFDGAGRLVAENQKASDEVAKMLDEQ